MWDLKIARDDEIVPFPICSPARWRVNLATGGGTSERSASRVRPCRCRGRSPRRRDGSGKAYGRLTPSWTLAQFEVPAPSPVLACSLVLRPTATLAMRSAAYGYGYAFSLSVPLGSRIFFYVQNGRCGQQRTEMQATVFHAPKIENPSSGPQKVYLVLYESLRYEQFHSGKQGLVRELILEGFHLLAQPNPRFHGSVAMRHKPTSLVSLVVVYSTIQPRILVFLFAQAHGFSFRFGQ